MKKIHINDLDQDAIYVYLNDNFREDLFQKARNNKKNWEDLIESLDLSIGHFYTIRSGKKYNSKSFIKLSILNKILEISKISFLEIEKNIELIKSGPTGGNIPNIFPLNLDFRIASLIGHATGDGHIKKDHFNFEYRNKSEELITKVCNLIKSVFKIKPKIYLSKDGTKQVETYSIIGYILYKLGATKGDKVLTKFDVPGWILNGDLDIQKAYILALADDEFCVAKSRNISFSLSKKINYVNNLIDFMNSIKKIFLNFNINSNSLKIKKKFIRKDGTNTIPFSFYITGQRNIKKFNENFKFTHKRKKERLNQISKYKRPPIRKYPYNEFKQIVFNKLKNGNKSSTQISKDFEIIQGSVIRRMKQLEKNKLVKKVKISRYGEFLWSLC